MTIANDWDVKSQTKQIKLRLYWLEYKLYHSANNSVLRTITETLKSFEAGLLLKSKSKHVNTELSQR